MCFAVKCKKNYIDGQESIIASKVVSTEEETGSHEDGHPQHANSCSLGLIVTIHDRTPILLEDVFLALVVPDGAVDQVSFFNVVCSTFSCVIMNHQYFCSTIMAYGYYIWMMMCIHAQEWIPNCMRGRGAETTSQQWHGYGGLPLTRVVCLSPVIILRP